MGFFNFLNQSKDSPKPVQLLQSGNNSGAFVHMKKTQISLLIALFPHDFCKLVSGIHVAIRFCLKAAAFLSKHDFSHALKKWICIHHCM
jgi:hypothetical protein